MRLRAKTSWIRTIALAVLLLRGAAVLAQSDKPTTTEPSLPDAPSSERPATNVGSSARLESPYEPMERLLTATKDTVMAGPTFSSMGESQCDDDGNLYFHVGDGVSFMNPTILKLGHSEDDHELFKPLPDKSASVRFASFSVTADGRVWVLTIEWSEGTPSIVALSYDDKGAIASRIPFATPSGFLPRQFTAFTDDTFFVAGEISVGSGSQKSTKSYAAMLDASGRVSREIDLDLSALKIQKGRLPEGYTTAGRDGNLYLLLSDKVAVVSRSGKLVRQLPYEKPDPDTVATRLVVSGGHLAIWLATTTKVRRLINYRFLVLDAVTGDQIGLYKPSEELGESAECFSRANGFTFLKFIKGNANGSIELLTAQVR